MRQSIVALVLAGVVLASCQPVAGPWPLATVPSETPRSTATPPAIASDGMSTPGGLSSPSPDLPRAPVTPASRDTPEAPTPAGGTPYLAALRPEASASLGKVDDLTQYDLDVTLSADVKSIGGVARIRYTNREGVPLDTVYLHLFPNLWEDGMEVSDVREGGRPAQVKRLAGDAIIGVVLPEPLLPGSSIDLSMTFTTPIPSGEGVGNYGELAYQGGVLALAHFYPTVVVYDDGWHLETPSSQGDVIYHDASLYDVRLTAPAGLTVVSTGATVDRANNGDGSATWRLVGGPMRDFNIVTSRLYRSETRQVGDVAVNSYFRPEDVDGGALVLGWAAQALSIYEQAFGPYPYRELDIVETATTAGGIEYPGMVVVAESLYNGPERRAFFEAATVHEVAHQWWYNVVGNDQVNAPWLDEALAQYSAYLYFQDVYGSAGGQGFLDGMNERWARVDYADKPIGLPVGDYAGREYGAIVYGRGPLFLVALRDRIGEAQMAELMRRYYSEYAWKLAQPDDFQKLAEAVWGQSLDDLFDKWVYPK